jgi:hypothetical protein
MIDLLKERGPVQFLAWNGVRCHVRHLIDWLILLLVFTVTHVHIHNCILKFHTSVCHFLLVAAAVWV